MWPRTRRASRGGHVGRCGIIVFVRVNRRWVTWLGTAVIGLALLTMLLWIGPAGSAWQANDDFAACITRADSLFTYRIDGEVNPEYISAMSECAQYCESIDDPSWLEMVGLFVQTRVSASQEGPSCVLQPGFSDIIPFLPGEDTADAPPP